MSRNVNDLLPKMKEKALEFMRLCDKANLTVFFTQTLRTWAEQDALYAQGRELLSRVNRLRILADYPPITTGENVIVTNAVAGMSWHNYGRAFDIALRKGRGASWDKKDDLNDNGVPDFEEAGRIGESIGLEWGGRWNKPDFPHFQLPSKHPISMHKTAYSIRLKNGNKSQAEIVDRLKEKLNDYFTQKLGKNSEV